MEGYREIFWESLAQAKLNKVLLYLLENWEGKQAIQFFDKLNGIVKKLARNPEIGTRIGPTQGSYSFPYSYYRLVYHFDKEKLIITNFIDMRSSEELK
ncbi:type II toxin-antitoxin system RelE/ParE family toxin [Owenweeksia hongkongensis]|uniref:type II toxin-antitoxin system RelE/ParE family toxin n=1 Tax=Owenweeksia hongkongensis TaxID=253245 RepID=UPI003A92871B